MIIFHGGEVAERFENNQTDSSMTLLWQALFIWKPDLDKDEILVAAPS